MSQFNGKKSEVNYMAGEKNHLACSAEEAVQGRRGLINLASRIGVILIISVLFLCFGGCTSYRNEPFDPYTKPIHNWRELLIKEFSEIVYVDKNGNVKTTVPEKPDNDFTQTFKFRIRYDQRHKEYIDCKDSKSKDPNCIDRKLEVLKFERDKVLGKLIRIGKMIHEENDHLLHVGRATSDILFDAGQLLTTAWATVAPVEQTKSILSAIATGTKGLQASFNSRLFLEQTTSALLSSMKEDRAEKLRPLVLGMSQDVNAYSLDIGLADAVAFMLAGSLPDALSQLSEAAQGSKKAAEDALNELEAKIAATKITAADLVKKEQIMEKLEGELEVLKKDFKQAEINYEEKIVEQGIEENKLKNIADGDPKKDEIINKINKIDNEVEGLLKEKEDKRTELTNKQNELAISKKELKELKGKVIKQSANK